MPAESVMRQTLRTRPSPRKPESEFGIVSTLGCRHPIARVRAAWIQEH
jgi:hypothetical protein